MKDVEITTKIRELIAENDLEAAIVLLKNNFSDHKKADEILFHSARLKDIQKRDRLQTLDYTNIAVHYNSIVLELLKLIREIEDKNEESIQNDKIDFASILSDSKNDFWEIRCAKSPYVSSVRNRYDYELSMKSYAIGPDPSLDITVLNNSNTPTVIDYIGIHLVEVVFMPLQIGGIPESGKIQLSDTYCIDFNDYSIFFNEELVKRGVNPRKISREVSIPCNIYENVENLDPIYFQSNAPYRFRLWTKGVFNFLPWFSIFRIVIKSDNKNYYSKNILVSK